MEFLKEFGDGHANIPKNVTSWDDQSLAEHFGGHVSCPVVNTLVKERSAQVMAERYLEILIYYQVVIDYLHSRPDIALEIVSPLDGLAGEPLTGYDADWIPPENLTVIPGPETPVGYALPRLITFFGGERKAENHSAKIIEALTLLEATITELNPDDTSFDLLLKYAEKLVVIGLADPLAVLKNTISAGKMRQDSFYTYFGEIVALMPSQAPTLAKIYSDLTSDGLKFYGIANPKNH